MKRILLYVPLVLCRLLVSEVQPDLYVTNVKGTLQFLPYSRDGANMQQVVIHGRTLYFTDDKGGLYTFSMKQGSVEIALVPHKALEAGIGFSTNVGLDAKRRRLSPFAHLERRNRERDQEDDSEDVKHRTNTKMIVLETKHADERPHRKTDEESDRYKRRDTPVPQEPKSFGYPSLHREPVERDTQRPMHQEMPTRNVHPREVPREMSRETPREVSREVPSKEKSIEKKRPLIESDSKMDDYGNGYVIRKVSVDEIDETRFRLVAGDSCVTYHNRGLIFAPCSTSAPEQSFKLEKSEDAERRQDPATHRNPDRSQRQPLNDKENSSKHGEREEPRSEALKLGMMDEPCDAGHLHKRRNPLRGRLERPRGLCDGDNIINEFKDAIIGNGLDEFF